MGSLLAYFCVGPLLAYVGVGPLFWHSKNLLNSYDIKLAHQDFPIILPLAKDTMRYRRSVSKTLMMLFLAASCPACKLPDTGVLGPSLTNPPRPTDAEIPEGNSFTGF